MLVATGLWFGLSKGLCLESRVNSSGSAMLLPLQGRLASRSYPRQWTGRSTSPVIEMLCIPNHSHMPPHTLRALSSASGEAGL